MMLSLNSIQTLLAYKGSDFGYKELNLFSRCIDPDTVVNSTLYYTLPVTTRNSLIWDTVDADSPYEYTGISLFPLPHRHYVNKHMQFQIDGEVHLQLQQNQSADFIVDIAVAVYDEQTSSWVAYSDSPAHRCTRTYNFQYTTDNVFHIHLDWSRVSSLDYNPPQFAIRFATKCTSCTYSINYADMRYCLLPDIVS